jgi:hypothetical protein
MTPVYECKPNPMPLRFPNARLYIQELIKKDGLTGAEAIASAAYEFGLVSKGSLPSMLEGPSENHCSCIKAVKNVLKKFHDEKSQITRLSAEAADIWSHIERDAQAHASATRSHTGCRLGVPADLNWHNCTSFAPVLFDLLLQQISRYY